MTTIQNRDELLHVVQEASKVMICEVKNDAKVLLRFLIKNNLKDKVKGLVFRGKKDELDKEVFGIPVYKANELEGLEDALYIMTKKDHPGQQNMKKQLAENGITNIAEFDYESYAEISREENKHMDFLCVGFTKCGTTSLSTALRKNKEIVFPKGKETFYLHWRNKYDDSPKKFIEKYYEDVPEGKIFGAIEPSYHPRAADVYETFGKDTKIIFMMRDPSKAAFSYFKMMVRRPRKKKYVNYYKKYKKYSAEMFEEFVNKQILTGKLDRYEYDLWIKEYLKYFPKEQIKLVFMEDLIADPEKTMDDIQDFIGVKKKKKIKELPHSNEGNGVSKNYLSAYINYRYYHSIRNKKENTSFTLKKRIFQYLAPKVQKYTVVENNDKISDKYKKILKEYYKESILEVERISGRDLSEIWESR